MKIKKGDRVRVLAGKDKGKEGEVMFALPAEGKVIVEGVNVAKKHQKPTQQKSTRNPMQGGIIDKDMPLDASNVAVLCEACGKPTRVGYRVGADGVKARICRKCGADI